MHAFSSFFAYHGLGFHPNMALTEGLAEALAPSRRSIGLDASAGYLIENNKISSIENLFSPLFWKESSSRAYTVAGSFMNYVIKNYKLDKAKRLYMGESLKDVFPSNYKDLIKNWKNKVVNEYKNENLDLEAERIYRTPSVLSDQCPHTKALYRNNDKDIWQTIRKDSLYDSKNYWQWRQKINPKDRYANYIILSENIHKTFKSGKSVDLKSLSKKFQLPAKNIEDIEIALLYFDSLIYSDKHDSAAKLIDKIAKLSMSLTLPDSLTRSIWARKS